MKALATLLLACAACEAAGSEPPGRLFFTPEQRAQLDVARSQRARKPIAVEAPVEEPESTSVLIYSGMVRRNDGRSTVWINNRPLSDSDSGTPGKPRAQLHPDGAASVTLPQQKRTVRLKVGQSVEVESGRVAENYARPVAAPEEAGSPPPVPAEPAFRLRRRIIDDVDVPPPERRR